MTDATLATSGRPVSGSHGAVRRRRRRPRWRPGSRAAGRAATVHHGTPYAIAPRRPAGPSGPRVATLEAMRIVLAHGASGSAASMRPHIDGLRDRGIGRGHRPAGPQGRGRGRCLSRAAGLAIPTRLRHRWPFVRWPGRQPARGRPGAAIAGLVLLSYPLHRPGEPAWEARSAHWPRIGVPVLLLSGESDPFARIDLLRRGRGRTPAHRRAGHLPPAGAHPQAGARATCSTGSRPSSVVAELVVEGQPAPDGHDPHDGRPAPAPRPAVRTRGVGRRGSAGAADAGRWDGACPNGWEPRPVGRTSRTACAAPEWVEMLGSPRARPPAPHRDERQVDAPVERGHALEQGGVAREVDRARLPLDEVPDAQLGGSDGRAEPTVQGSAWPRWSIPRPRHVVPGRHLR